MSILTDDLAREIAETLIDGHTEVGEGVAIVDPPRYQYANEAFCAMTGFTLEELRALPSFSDIAVEEERPILRARLEARLRGSDVPDHYEAKIHRKDGTLAILEVVVRTIDTRLGVRTVSLVRDATERHRTVARVIEADRLAQLGRRVAEVAHELANPLFAVLTNLDVVARKARDVSDSLGDRAPPELAEMRAAIEAAIDATARIRGVVSDLRSEARPERESIRPIDLASVLRRAVAAIPRELRARGRLIERIDELPCVVGNDTKLLQVFVNLLTNAFQALDDRREGAVTLSASADPLGRVFVDVTDTGVGIPREDLGRIFEPFFTTKAIGTGIGLGLVISVEIVRAMGGEIVVDSTAGVGTTMRVKLRT